MNATIIDAATAPCGPERGLAIRHFVDTQGAGSAAYVCTDHDGSMTLASHHAMRPDQLATVGISALTAALAGFGGSTCLCDRCTDMAGRVGLALQILRPVSRQQTPGDLH